MVTMSNQMNSDDESVSEELAELRTSIDELRDYVQILTRAIDDLTIELQWRNRQSNDGQFSPTTPVLTSMPLDPTARDWQINRHTPADLPPETPALPQPRRQTLFD
jgi:hypothetical protein